MISIHGRFLLDTGLGFRKEVFLPGPHSESEMPEFYSVCLGLFKDFRRSFPDVPLDQLTVKRIYQLLLDKIFERPRVEYDISLPCQKLSPMCNCIWRPYIGQLEKDVAYRVLHGGLPTKDRLYRFGISRCRLCCLCWTQEESFPHLFRHCSVLQDALHFLDEILFWLCNHRLKMDLALVRFNSVYFPRGNTDAFSLFLCLVFIYRRAVWIKRNSGLRRGKPISPSELLGFFKILIKERA